MKNLLIVSAAVCALALQSHASVVDYDVSSKEKCTACGWGYNEKVGDQAAGLKFNKDGKITSPVSSYAINSVSFSYACSGTATTTRGFYFKPYDGDGNLVPGYEAMLPFATLTTNYTFTVAQNVRKVVILMTGSGSTGTFVAKSVSFGFFQLETPADLEESGVSRTGFGLSWSPVSGADSYDVEVKSGEDVVFQENSIESVSCAVSGLSAGTEYSVFVTAVADDIYEPSEPAELSVTTEPLAVLDAPVLSLGEADVTTSSAAVSWSSVNNASGYAVAVLFNGLPVVSETLSPSSASWTASDLQSGTEYTFSVAALGDGVDYADSAAATVDFTTATDSSAPEWTVNPETPAFAAGHAGSFTVSAVRGDDNLTSSITLSVSPSPVSEPVLSDGSVSWTPAWEDAGKTFIFTFSVSAGGNDYEYLVLIPLEALPTLSLSVDPVSAAINLGETAETLLSAEASDDRDPLALTAVVCGSEDLAAHLDAETGAFSWTPSAAGEYTVVFDASADAAYPLSAPVSFAVAVTNAAPALSMVSTNGVKVAADLADVTAGATKAITIVVSATDVAKAPALSVSQAYADGFTVTTNGTTVTGTLVWTFDKVGETFDIVFTAADALDPSLSVEKNITVSVVDPPLESVWPSVDEIGSNSFLLEWGGQDQPRLDHFALRVWYGSCDMGSETTDKETFYEWYDNYRVKDSAYFPQGWSVDCTDRYDNANHPLKVAWNGCKVITKKYPRPVTEFSFRVNRYSDDLNFELYASGGGVDDADWVLVESVVKAGNGAKTYKFSESDGYRRFKIVRPSAKASDGGNGNFGVGSFSATYAGAGTHFVVGSKDEPVVLDKETSSYVLENLKSGREYFVQFVTCGTSGEEKGLYAGNGTREFYTRVMTLEDAEKAPPSVVTVY